MQRGCLSVENANGSLLEASLIKNKHKKLCYERTLNALDVISSHKIDKAQYLCICPGRCSYLYRRRHGPTSYRDVCWTAQRRGVELPLCAWRSGLECGRHFWNWSTCGPDRLQYSLSALLGTLCGDRILPTWHPICVRGGRSQTGIGIDRSVEAGRSTFVTRHRAQERKSQQWRKTVASNTIKHGDGKKKRWTWPADCKMALPHVADKWMFKS